MNDTKKNKQFSKAEIAEAHIISENITGKEREEMLLEFGALRRQMVASLSNEQRLLSAILQLRFQIEDHIKKQVADKSFTFGFFLKEYISRLQLKNKEFAEQIGIEPTEVSQLLNAHRKPNDRILIRLEIHSNKNIDALLWYKIVEKEKEFELVHNTDLRKQEQAHVKQFLTASF